MKFDLNDFFSKEELIELLETLKLKINELEEVPEKNTNEEIFDLIVDSEILAGLNLQLTFINNTEDTFTIQLVNNSINKTNSFRITPSLVLNRLQTKEATARYLASKLAVIYYEQFTK